jgi:aryl-alcohol dehydrogenase-like predicted oxidoreductase
LRKRPLGKTGLLVSELALGTWGLSGDAYGAVSQDDLEATLRLALDLGINLIETSDAYGLGGVESAIGALLGAWRSENPDKPVTVCTKIGIDRSTSPPTRNYTKAYLEAAAAASLARLKGESLDLLLLAHPNEVELGRSWDITDNMRALRDAGICKHWGVATGSSDVAALALEQGASVVELPYNLLHVTDVNRAAGDVLVNQAGLLVRSVLSYGLLGDGWDATKEFSVGDHRRERWTTNELEERVRQREQMRFLLRDGVKSMRGAAVRFVLESPVVSSAVLGPKNPAQLRALIAETGVGPKYLPHEDMREVYRVLERAGMFP